MKSDVLGVNIDQVDINGAMLAINGYLAGAGQHLIVTVNPEFILEARKNEQFRQALNSASLATADGIGVVLAAKLLSGQKLFRVTGVDLCLKLLADCSTAKMFLLGGAEGVAAEVRSKYPLSGIRGAESGGRLIADKYELEQNDAIIAKINDSGANLLLVAFGQVKQEMWIRSNLPRMPKIKAAIGIGGTFDYLSGRVSRAPQLIRTLGLEWLYRLVREPKRFKRIWRATVVFPLAVIARIISKKS